MSEQPISLPELAELHTAMARIIREAMPQVVDVQHYPKLQEGLPMPALYFALSGLAPGPDPGDGRTAVMATFEACVLVESDREQAHLQAAILATKLVRLLDHDQYWGVECVDQAQDVHAMPSESIPELLQCAAWTVQWRHVLYLGDTEWPWEDQPPGSLLFAFDPDSGPGSEHQYQGPEAMG
ncbi:hypothetical protein [Pseudomonas asiatica]|uniref:Phage protein n=1 Tax=Pseudomonas asiatica TaxID=2219225 RepID=A0ABU5L484_9PSED|nr:hypothetical protein [Pseudomonas asiatica]MDZ5740964.1 hypothetical protein [Pseudomonas asiatica]MDZ5746285.1 hypothetical protein [Pseudomonas asiatica]MDZ5751270.1 hypothetical protein [Pseudomonas asiatica]MDZ5756262.1 hypothetical protein [Pseudomonas asiatica]